MHQIVKRLPGSAKVQEFETISLDEPLFGRYLSYVHRVALVAFALGLSFAYALEFRRHGRFAPLMIFSYIAAFTAFILFASLTESLVKRMQQRTHQLQRENVSRIFRFFLYAGALLGLAALLLCAGYIWAAQMNGQTSSGIWLLPAFSAAVVLFWLRFHSALVARTADYAYELLRRQEAILPLTGTHNPLWRLRQVFAVVNRFFFFHLEYMVLSLVVLTVGYRIELQSNLVVYGVPGLLLSVFALGAVASVAALLIMRLRDKTSPETFLWSIRTGYIAALSVQSITCYLVFIVGLGWHIKYFWIIFLGSLTTFLLNLYSAVFVAENHRTARSLISAAATSVSTVVHRGIAAGMRGAAVPALIVAAVMSVVYLLGIIDERGDARFVHGLFALALALTAMISLFPVAQAAALVMPLASSAIGRLRLGGRKEEHLQLLHKFRNLRSVAMPSYVLHAKVFYAALVILIFLVYTQLIGDGGSATLFKHLTETAAMLIGGIASFFLAARINELVLNLGPALVRETSRQFREISGLSSAESQPDMLALWRVADHYLSRKITPLFLGTLILPAFACLIGGNYGLTGYLIGFGFFGFLNSNSWLTTGAAWSSARHAAEADAEVSRHSAQLDALVQADIVGDSMHEAVAPTLASAMLTTLVAALLFSPATLELHEYLREWVKSAF